MSQKQKLLEHFKKGGKVTTLSAYPLLGILSLTKRVAELRSAGHKIRGVRQPIQKSNGIWSFVTVYSLATGRNASGR